MTTKTNQKKWIKTFQFFAAYLVAAWTLLQFVDWILNRYNISPYWVDLLLWFFIGIIPSLLIYLYHHERLNQLILKRREKIIFPLNIVLLLVTLYIGFGNSDLGATTKEISYTNASGELETKTITKAEFRVHVPIFNFEQVKQDSSSLWMGNIINDLIYYDLQQDKTVSPHLFGTATTVDKVNSVKPFCDYYVDGEFEQKDGLFIITPFIRNSQNGKIITKQTFEGTDFLNLLDDVSIFIKSNVGIINEQQNYYIDLNLKDFVTSSLEALEEFEKGDYEKAVEIDSTFALAYHLDANNAIRFSQGQFEEQRLSDKAYEFREKLPLQKQLKILIQRNIAYNQWKNAEELIKLQLEIDPNDREYQELLYTIYAETRDIENYVKFAESNYAKEKSAPNVFKGMEAMYLIGNYERSLDVMSKYQLRYPDLKNIIVSHKIKPFILNNNLKEAKDAIRQTLLLNPDLKLDSDYFMKAVTYREENLSKAKEYSAFIGSYRHQSNEQILHFFENKGVLITSVSSQGLYTPIKASDNLLIDFGGPEFRQFEFLKESSGVFYAVKLNITYSNNNTNTFYYWKEDDIIRTADSLLKANNLAEAKKAYQIAIKKHPKHFYLKDALKHVEYIQSIDSLALINQFKEVTGTYGPRKFWIENGKFFYKRDGFPKIELIPIAKDIYINMTKFQDQFTFEYENGRILTSSAQRYNIEKEIWEKLEDESNTFKKD
ncbi:MAG TPA: hypothetical protein VGA80_04305 [Flavobacteriaceae bacterium]